MTAVLSASRSAAILALATVYLTTGCAATLYGVRPDEGDYLKKAKAQCETRHKTAPALEAACTDYEQRVAEAYGFIDAYESRARLNDMAIYAGGILALAGVGAFAGLSAFGLAGSDAAKIIPLVGAFFGGAIAYSQNEEKAIAYEDAANVLRAELAKTAGVKRDTASYEKAADQLRATMQHVAIRLTQKLREAANPEKRKAAQLEEAEKRLKRIRAGFYDIKDIKLLPQAAPPKVELELNQPVRQIMVDFPNMQVAIDDVKFPAIAYGTYTVTADIPPAFTPGPHNARIFLDDDIELPRVMLFTYP